MNRELHRARSGHSCARAAHLYRIGIDKESPNCRHCEELIPETIEHQLLHCTALDEALSAERAKYDALHAKSFDDALWHHATTMNNILESGKRKGIYL